MTTPVPLPVLKRIHDHGADERSSDMKSGAAIAVDPYVFDPDFAPNMIFTITHDDENDDVVWPLGGAWQTINRDAFLKEWIHQSGMNHILRPLKNDENGGIGSLDDLRQLRFDQQSNSSSFGYISKLRVYVSLGRWTFQELQKLMIGFMVTMDTTFAIAGLSSITTAGTLELAWNIVRPIKYQYDTRITASQQQEKLICDGFIQPVIRGFYHHHSHTTGSDRDRVCDVILDQFKDYDQVVCLSYFTDDAISNIEKRVKDKLYVAVECSPPSDFNCPTLRALNAMATESFSSSTRVREIWIFNPYFTTDASSMKHWMNQHIFKPSLLNIRAIRMALTEETDEFLPRDLVQMWIDYIISIEISYDLINTTNMNKSDIVNLIGIPNVVGADNDHPDSGDTEPLLPLLPLLVYK